MATTMPNKPNDPTGMAVVRTDEDILALLHAERLQQHEADIRAVEAVRQRDGYYAPMHGDGVWLALDALRNARPGT